MKTDILMKYLQKNKCYCVNYRLALALTYVRNYDHIIKELLQLAPYIDRKNLKYQAEITRNTYNYEYKNY